jgi:hypothetical protein
MWFRSGRWDLAERLVEEACTAIAQVERPGPWTTLFRLRSLRGRGSRQTGRARTTLRPLIDEANRAGRTVWESLFLSTLAFVQFADNDHAAVDAALTRMYRCTQDIGIRDLAPDRSEPLYVESLIALGEVERVRAALARLEERGRIFPRLWIDVTLPRTRAMVRAAEGELGKAPHQPRVATKVVISPKTVQANLARVYRKLGISSRGGSCRADPNGRKGSTPGNL